MSLFRVKCVHGDVIRTRRAGNQQRKVLSSGTSRVESQICIQEEQPCARAYALSVDSEGTSRGIPDRIRFPVEVPNILEIYRIARRFFP